MVLAGETIHASDIETGVWDEYTVSWTATTTNPALGNGTSEAWYTTIGKTVHFGIMITLGSTTTVGTGSYLFSLPAAAAAHGLDFQITADFFDSSAGRHYLCVGQITSGSSTITRTRVEGNSTLGAAAPVVPANGDIIYFTGTYEAA